MEKVNYDVRDQFNQPLLNRAKLIEIIKEEREARERAEGALRRIAELPLGDHSARAYALAALKSSESTKGEPQ